MKQVIFEIDNKKDANLLVAIAEKIGIKKHRILKITESVEKDRGELFKIIDAGVDVSNFGDPSLWQRETRKTAQFQKFQDWKFLAIIVLLLNK
jgi:hypothetical protein